MTRPPPPPPPFPLASSCVVEAYTDVIYCCFPLSLPFAPSPHRLIPAICTERERERERDALNIFSLDDEAWKKRRIKTYWVGGGKLGMGWVSDHRRDDCFFWVGVVGGGLKRSIRNIYTTTSSVEKGLHNISPPQKKKRKLSPPRLEDIWRPKDGGRGKGKGILYFLPPPCCLVLLEKKGLSWVEPPSPFLQWC